MFGLFGRRIKWAKTVYAWQERPAAVVMKEFPVLPEIDKDEQEKELQKVWRESFNRRVDSNGRQ